ncbi:cupin domain-containing protein [uncultured Jannaschia sp.]|uniref:cupin domain-containing protein n=1 Tax=uncultured Jannaschia sp. TaxID=293347 RepID=UPI002616592C|nr:cupin domain-containing protein [uncultured Jannaschia sp.]
MRRITTLPSLSSLVIVAALAAGFATVGQPLLAQDAHHKIVAADDVAFGEGPPHLPPGIGLVVMAGKPSEPGLYVLRLKFPAGMEIPPHTHPEDEHVTVLSGGFGIGMGETLDRDAAPMMGPGSFFQMPANMAHYAWAEEETVVQLTGTGPFQINYVNEGDDPRTN